ncbi:helix-turn-helix domain-containing protein [Cellvibrio sp. QJXJ]|uniref:helix-turn-helix domain-containing protein n=1 Tax=Cellvibrio sp. QJXJ TaxID=2964606 RepID=UPI0021C27CF5|nr:helix-turn-helix transcriptional regulator [Cellvibrio sp. QJXJ]UUA71693.1 helix-turn-helix domain-containing protein [Cellvibrio sp. QJXJ]
MNELSPLEREDFLRNCLQELLQGETSEGKILTRLRKKILGMNQNDYAALVGLSRRTLSDLENDTGDQSLSVINAAFKPFGLRLGLLPTHQHLLVDCVKNLPELTSLRKVNGFRR